MLSNNPNVARLFIMEGDAKQPIPLRAVTLKGLTFTQDYVWSQSEDGMGGVRIEGVPRIPDPTDFTITFEVEDAGMVSKTYQLWKQARDKNCQPKFLLASAECPDETRIDDPTYARMRIYVDAVVKNFQPGNDTNIFAARNDAGRLQTQLTLSAKHMVVHAQPQLFKVNSTALGGATLGLAVSDQGKCANIICRNYAPTGGNKIVATQAAAVQTSVVGGDAAWTSPSGFTAPSTPFAFSGNQLVVDDDDILMSTDDGLTFTSVNTDAAFTTLSNIILLDNRTLLVTGLQSATWKSIDGGANWTKIAVADAALPDMLRICKVWNEKGMALYGIGYATTTYKITKSMDQGKTWSIVGSIPTITYANTKPVDALGTSVKPYFVAANNLYTLAYTSETTEAIQQISLAGSPVITNIGAIDPYTNPNDLFAAIYTAGGGQIWHTVDGFASTGYRLSAPWTLTGASTKSNPFAPVRMKYGDSLYVAMGTQVYEIRDWESLFVS